MDYNPCIIGYAISQNDVNVAAAYVILGAALIGRELENPFGDDFTDVDMEGFIRQLKVELTILVSKALPTPGVHPNNIHPRRPSPS